MTIDHGEALLYRYPNSISVTAFHNIQGSGISNNGLVSIQFPATTYNSLGLHVQAITCP